MDLDFSDLGLEVTKPKAGLETASALFYGPVGCGKTTLATSVVDVAELSPVLVVDFENSTASVAEQYGDHPDLDVVQVREWKKAENLIEALCTKPHKYKTVIMDPMNNLVHLLMQHMNKLVEYKRSLLHKESVGKITAAETAHLAKLASVKMQDNVNNSLGEATTSLADYGMIGTKMTKVIYDLNAAPFLTLFVTHANNQEDDRGRTLSIRPDMPGNVSKERITEKPHLVGFVRKVQTKDEEGNAKTSVVVQFEGGKTAQGIPFAAKRRLNVPNTMLNPTMTDIWNHINGGK